MLKFVLLLLAVVFGGLIVLGMLASFIGAVFGINKHNKPSPKGYGWHRRK